MTTPFMRPVRADDLAAIHALARQSGGGMTNLPMDQKSLKAKIDIALESFASNSCAPGAQAYMLVLEREGQVIGSAGVFSQIGLKGGFINYRVNREFYSSAHRERPLMRRVLVPSHDFTGRAEVGQLFIAPSARGGGFGKLLARARYMFMAQKPEIIADHVCAELRGWRAPDGSQPFWEAVGRHFFEMEFEAADAYNAAHGNQFIEDLMPRYPIYVALLPKAARDCIGKPHDSAVPAYKMLMEEGFQFNDYIDVFDGGPLLDVKVNNIRTIRESRLLQVVGVESELADPEALLASGEVQTFRCARAPARILGEEVVISSSAARALGVESGSMIRWASW